MLKDLLLFVLVAVLTIWKETLGLLQLLLQCMNCLLCQAIAQLAEEGEQQEDSVFKVTERGVCALHDFIFMRQATFSSNSTRTCAG
jgi:predicted transcriptional regulator